METRANYVAVGAITLALAALGVLAALWLGSLRFNADYTLYDITFDAPVRGLENGGEVRFNGIKVGEVEQLRLDPTDPTKVIARVRLQSATPVRADSVAQLEPLGLTGLSYVQISGGTPAAPRMRAGFGEVLKLRSVRGQLDALFEGGEGVIEATLRAVSEATTVLNRASLVLDDRNRATLRRTLENLDATTAMLARNEALLTESTRAATALADAGGTLASAARTYDQLGADVSGRVATIGDETTVAIREIQAAAAALRATAEETGRLAVAGTATAQGATRALDVAAAETLPDVAEAARELRATAQSLDALAKAIQDNPGAFAQGAPKPRVEWRR